MHLAPTAFALLVFMVFQVDSSYKMIVAHGKPQSFTASKNYSLSWTKCVDFCLANDNCLAIYELNSQYCQVFNVGQIKTATRLSSGYRLGVKRLTTSTICPATLTSYKENSYIYTNSSGTYQSYTVTYADPLWTFNASSLFVCPKNFQMFIRTRGPWCLQVGNASRCVNQTESADKCGTDYGAVLSGVETTQEYNFLIGKFIQIPSQPSTDWMYGFWVDGWRKPACTNLTKATTTCNGTNEFTFTDPTLSTVPQGYVWGYRQPDGRSPASTGHNCIAVRIQNKVSSGMDDGDCSMNEGLQHCFIGFVCGLRPSPV